MITEFKIFESNRSYLYHFTHLPALEKILKNGILFKGNDLDWQSFSISTTRRSDFDWGAVRIVLDTDKIKSRYKIVPIDYFRNVSKGYFKNMPFHTSQDQQEERIISNKKGYLSPTYFVQIDINEDWSLETKNKELIMYRYGDEFVDYNPNPFKFHNPHNVKINIVKNFKTVKW